MAFEILPWIPALLQHPLEQYLFFPLRPANSDPQLSHRYFFGRLSAFVAQYLAIEPEDAASKFRLSAHGVQNFLLFEFVSTSTPHIRH
jgi:hypothetical protein